VKYGASREGRVRAHLTCRMALFMLLLVAAGGLCGQTSAPAAERRVELSANAGYGSRTSDEGGKKGVSALGVTLGWRSPGSHDFEFGYLLMDIKVGMSERWHLLSVGYVVQSRSERVRPFFRVGVAGGVERSGPRAPSPGVPASVYGRIFTSTRGGLFVGAGATVDVRKAFFIRPQLNCYLLAGGGLNRLILPSVAVGWRF